MQNSNQGLNAFIQAARLATWAWHIPSGRLRVNEHWATLLGLNPQELEPCSLQSWSSRVHPDDLPRAQSALDAHLRGESQRYACELRLRHQAGHWLWVQDYGHVVQRDQDAEPLLMCGGWIDIQARKQAEAALRASETLLARSQQIAHIGSWRLDLRSGVLEWSDEVYRIFGTEPRSFGASYPAFLNFVHPDDRAALDAAYQASLPAGGPAYDFVHRIVRADSGEVRWVHEQCEHERDASGAVLLSVGNAQDITQQRQTEERLRLAASVFESASESIIITDAQGRILEVNPAFSALTGYHADEVRGRNPHLLASGLHDAAFFRQLWQAIRQDGVWAGEIWNRRKNGEVYPEWMVIHAVLGPDGQALHYCSHSTDLSLVKTQKQQIERLSQFDALTGLPNRRLLYDRLSQGMAQALRRSQHLALVSLDLDDFKRINDSLGAESGDRLLVALAAQMKAVLQEGDTLARLGGDEFVAVLTDLPERSSASKVLERLLAACSQPGSEWSHVQGLSASLGVTFFPQALAVDADQLLRQANQAVFDAKQHGKKRIFYFDTEHDQQLRQRHETLKRIRHALQQREFVLHYQPKVNLRSGQLLGVEALLRWQHPEHGLLPPGAFLPALDGHRLMVELGDWVIETALAQIECWRASGLHLPVSVNVDALQLDELDFLDKLRAALARYPGVQPDDFELEVLESSALGDLESVCGIIRACRGLGVACSLDDFGTGYSSLTYFKHLPVGSIKIDQSFVRDLPDNPDNVPILRGVIGLAAAFERLAIAEGVETLAHGELLLRLGCEHGQGYAIAKPMPARQVPDWLAQWQTPAAWASASAAAQNVNRN